MDIISKVTSFLYLSTQIQLSSILQIKIIDFPSHQTPIIGIHAQIKFKTIFSKLLTPLVNPEILEGVDRGVI